MTFTEHPPAAAVPNRAEIGAALAWWRDAGVDCDFADTARSWLAASLPDVAEPAAPPPPPPRPVAPAAPPRMRLGGDPESWPVQLDDFSAWWLAEPSLDGGMTQGRLAPCGSAGAGLMVLVDHPEAEDRDQLLSGPQGRMLRAICRALGFAEAETYLASALPRHMPLPDWAALAEDGLGAVTAHHVALVRPRRLLVFGNNVSSLLGHDPANSTGFLHGFDQGGPSIPALVAPGLSALAQRPRGKARLWQALLDWMGTDLT